jgi:hypothetical protein
MGQSVGGSVPPAGSAATDEAANKRLRVHTAVATALVLGSSIGLMAETRTTAAGAGIAATVFGLLFVLAILYYVEVRVRSSRHRK